MKLIDLEPRWIHINIFVFLCPHCRSIFLSCKNAQISEMDQHRIFEAEFGEDWMHAVVPTRADQSWSISGSVPRERNAAFITDLTVTPSIDASKSGHWHGSITNGEVT